MTLISRLPNLLAILLLAASTEAYAAQRWNVLWICADDHAPYVIGAYGNPRARTPNIDRLAASGMRFDRAFCNSPVCTASRQSFITGRYPRTLGVTQLRTALPAKEQTLADVLKTAGYHTAAIGKMHFNSRLQHGFELRLDLEDYAKALAARGGPQPIPSGIEIQPRWRPFKDPAPIWLNSSVRPIGKLDADMDGTYFVQEAARWLRQPRSEPFLLLVSFYQPHSPFQFPVEDRGTFNPSDFPVPAVAKEDLPQVPSIFTSLTETQKQGITAAYYTSVAYLDRNVGRLLDALQQSGHASDTLVIYTGDHGYFLGQHGRFEKHSCYEEAVRAPLIIRHPHVTRPGSASSALVEFIDIFPTVLEVCGVPIPANVQGQSLLPLLTGRSQQHRRHVFIEYAPNEEAAVRDERWKLVFQRGKVRRRDGYDTVAPPPGRTVRLYDLTSDPQELTDVASAPENTARVAKMLRSLAEHLRKTAREGQESPPTTDPQAILDYCVQSRDVFTP